MAAFGRGARLKRASAPRSAVHICFPHQADFETDTARGNGLRNIRYIVADLFLALIHYPVLNRNGHVITSAITSLDLHDIARSARTYGVRSMYVVHPVIE